MRDLASSLCRGDFTSVLRSTRNEALLAAVGAAVEAAAEDDSISMWAAHDSRVHHCLSPCCFHFVFQHERRLIAIAYCMLHLLRAC